MEILTFFITPIMGGVIALSTNWLAIRMLFRPHTEKRIFGLKLPFTPGLIPKERARLTRKMAEAISTRLLTPEVLASELSDPSLWPLPDMTVAEALTEFGAGAPADLVEPIGSRLKIMAESLLPKAITALQSFPEAHPELDAKLAEFTYKIIDENVSRLAGMFISKDKVYTSIKNGITEYLTTPENYYDIIEKIHTTIDELMANEPTQQAIIEKLLAINIRDGLTMFFQKEKHAVERVLSLFASYLAAHMPVQAMIENKMAAFEVAEAEEIILSVAGRELKVIVMLGGVLGFVIGLLAVLL